MDRKRYYQLYTKHLQDVIDDKKDPDIVIVDNRGYFYVKIKSQNINLNTGIGGFKQFLKACNYDLTFYKVVYNDKVLNLKEKNDLCQQMKYKR